MYKLFKRLMLFAVLAPLMWACNFGEPCSSCEGFSEFERAINLRIIDPYDSTYRILIGTKSDQYHPDSIEVLMSDYKPYYKTNYNISPLNSDSTDYIFFQFWVLHNYDDHPKYDVWRDYYIRLSSTDIDTLSFNYKPAIDELSGRPYYKLRWMYNGYEVTEKDDYYFIGYKAPKFYKTESDQN